MTEEKDKRRMSDSAFMRRFFARIELTSGGCWLWLGRVNDSTPIFFPPKSDLSVSVRRWMLGITAGSRYIIATAVCGNHRCVNPAHLVAIRTARNKRIVPRLDENGKNRYVSDVTEDQINSVVSSIRSGMSQRSVGVALGLSQSTVSRIWQKYK